MLANPLTLLIAAPAGARTKHATHARAYRAVPGVLDVTISPHTFSAFVRCDPNQLDVAALRAAIDAAHWAARTQNADGGRPVTPIVAPTRTVAGGTNVPADPTPPGVG